MKRSQVSTVDSCEPLRSDRDSFAGHVLTLNAAAPIGEAQSLTLTLRGSHGPQSGFCQEGFESVAHSDLRIAGTGRRLRAGEVIAVYRSAGVSPVFLATFASMRGPTSAESWNANT